VIERQFNINELMLSEDIMESTIKYLNAVALTLPEGSYSKHAVNCAIRDEGPCTCEAEEIQEEEAQELALLENPYEEEAEEEARDCGMWGDPHEEETPDAIF
jgi:hypothetical protein